MKAAPKSSISSKSTLPSKNTRPSRSSVQLKESKTTASEDLVSNEKEAIESHTIEKLRSIELHEDREHNQMKGAPLDSYQPESWMVEEFKQETKQLLHLAIVSYQGKLVIPLLCFHP